MYEADGKVFRTRVRFPPAPPKTIMEKYEKIDGYCSCCGAPNMDGSQEHDLSCIWYEDNVIVFDGADQAFDGVMSTEADNTVGDDRKSSKTFKRKQ